MIAVAIDSERNVRDALRDGVPLDHLHSRRCNGCGTDLFIAEGSLMELAGYVVTRYRMLEPALFYCPRCARKVERCAS